MDITGIIKKIYPLRQGTSTSTGQPWKSIAFLLETEDRYPQSACFQLMNDNCTRFNIKEGDKVKVQFDMKAREWENKGYNTLNAWKVDKVL